VDAHVSLQAPRRDKVSLLLIKREDGFTMLQEVQQLGLGGHREGTRLLSPDDVVDGIPAHEWPVGVFAVSSFVWSRHGDA
jgi:hypothetical protein